MLREHEESPGEWTTQRQASPATADRFLTSTKQLTGKRIVSVYTGTPAHPWTKE